MKPSLHLAWSYLKNLGKKWILWLFLVLDLIAITVQIFIPSLTLHQGIYVGIAVLGLLWAGFETYLDLLSKIPSEARPLQPEIAILFEEGNEYSYRFEQVQDIFPPDQLEHSRKIGTMAQQERNLTQAILPNSILSLHVRVENIGLVAVNILTIGGNMDFDKPYQFMVPKAHNRDDTPLSFPVMLKPKEKLPITVVVPVHPFSLLTDAQIAARTRNLREAKMTIEAKIYVEVIDPNGKIFNYRAENKVSVLPICDLYITRWRELNKKRLVALALGETSPATGDNQPDEQTSQAGSSQRGS